MDRKPVESEHTLGPVGGAAVGLPGLARTGPGRRLHRLRRRGAGAAPRRRDWGPPAELTPRRTALAALALIASASLVVWSDGLDWTPDRMLLVFLAPALVLRRAWRYLGDFVPFAILIFAYAECRGLAHL